MLDLVCPFAREQQYANNDAVSWRTRRILKTREIRIITVAFKHGEGEGGEGDKATLLPIKRAAIFNNEFFTF